MILYKYLIPERVKDVLGDGRIRYTQLGALNDPFEGKPCLKAVNTDTEITEILDQVVKEFSDESPALSAILESTLPQRRERMRDFLHADIPSVQKAGWENFAKNYGVLSLTEKRDHQLMWSHYANEHKGFAIGFDATHEHFFQQNSVNDAFRYFGKVEYRRQRPSGILSEMDVKDLFLVKSDVWDYEREWRIIRAIEDADLVPNPTAPYPNSLFTYPKSTISEIIFGAQIQAECRQEIMNLVRNASILSHVGLFQAEVSQKEFAIEIKELSP